jgi:hypothetical protein
LWTQQMQKSGKREGRINGVATQSFSAAPP